MGNNLIAMLHAAVDYYKSNPETATKDFQRLVEFGVWLTNAVILAKNAYAQAPPAPAPMPMTMSQEEIAEARIRAREELGVNTVSNFNIAFCGQVKAGKSRMINAVRGVKKGEDGWAEVANMRCTNSIRPYVFKNGANPHLVLWDCPGAGQPEDGDKGVKTYFKDKMLYAFDCLLLFLGETPREEDLVFAREAFLYGVPFAFVRSKCDINLSEREEEGASIHSAKSSFLQENEAAFKAALRRGGDVLADAPLFFVSAVTVERIERDGGQQPNDYLLQEPELLAYVLSKTLPRRGYSPEASEAAAVYPSAPPASAM